MSGTHVVTVGDRGRLVVPVEVRDGRGLHEGTRLVVVDTDDGLVLLTRDQARRRLRDELEGGSLVDELLRERRAAAADEDGDVAATDT